MEFLNTEKAPKAIGPYSQATKAGNTIYVSGQLPVDMATGELVTDSVEKATLASLNNIKAILEAGGAKIENIVRCGVFVKDLNDFAKVNAVYGEFFGNHKPARACVEVARLPKDALVEIEATAVL